MNTQLPYEISYAPPITVKDGPHRILDTLEGWKGETEVKPQDYAQVCEAAEQIDIKTVDLIPVEVG